MNRDRDRDRDRERKNAERERERESYIIQQPQKHRRTGVGRLWVGCGAVSLCRQAGPSPLMHITIHGVGK